MSTHSLAYIESLARLHSSIQSPKLGLDQIRQLLAALNFPQRSMAFIHVAGTNGKGSVCAFIDSMLRADDISTGWFSSPHLTCARERIRIGGRLVSERDFCWAEKLVWDASQVHEIQASYFERIFAMVLLVFQKYGVKIAVLEVGLGGRLDATNVVEPLVCGISRIDLDHVHILGDSLGEIAREKAGIIKANVPVVSAAQHPQAAKSIDFRAHCVGAPLTYIGQDYVDSLDERGLLSLYRGKQQLLCSASLGLAGSYQQRNASLAVAILAEAGLVKSLVARNQGLANVKWPGRYETVQADPLVIMDGGHNPAGFQGLIHALSNDARLSDKPVIVVLGLTDGHQSSQTAEVWQQGSVNINSFIFTESRNARALNAHTIASMFSGVPGTHSVIPSSQRALRCALRRAQEIDAAVLVTGSLYLVGELRLAFFNAAADPVFPVF